MDNGKSYNRKIVFTHQDGYGEHNRHEVEFEFSPDTTKQEIEDAFSEWVWNIVGDNFNWYEKEQEV